MVKLRLPGILFYLEKMVTFLSQVFIMAKEEIKNEINKVLDQFSDPALKELLTFLQQLEKKVNVYSVDTTALNNILSEDEELLKKLAQ